MRVFITICIIIAAHSIVEKNILSPVIVMTGGEHLSDDLRARLSDTFHCYAQTFYACTEGGTVA